MPRFNPDPTQASGGITNLPKDSYTFEVSNFKAFDMSKDLPDGSRKESYGVQFEAKVVSEGAYKGRKIYPRLWLHNDGSRNAAKGFLLAVTGYTSRQENEWNGEYGGKDWSFDTDDKSVGSGWHELSGKLIAADVDVKMLGDMESQTIRWRIYQ